jgi:endonuclease III
MEQHKDDIRFDRVLTLDMGAEAYYQAATEFANQNYEEMVDRIYNTRFNMLPPDKFFDEYMWAVYVSGFRAKTISKIWSKLTTVYDQLGLIGDPYDDELVSLVKQNAMKIFANERKVDAIIETADIIRNARNTTSWEEFLYDSLSTPEKLQRLPFIGKITRYHLARNIGLLQYVKPDVHLVRMANKWGFDNPQVMCESLDGKKPAGIVDLILWLSASHFGTT